MSVQPKEPKVTRITTVANISTTQRFAVERSSMASPPPSTRPPIPPRPAPTVIPKDKQGTVGISKAPTALRMSLEQHARPPQRRVIIPMRTGIGNAEPPEGVGPGTVPPGGFKIK